MRIEPWEREEVGDVTGKRLLHVQCHFGLDTLSWARLGASSVTGVDFSEPAIAFARELAVEVGLADRSRFLVSDVYDLPGPLAGETFDVVYTGRGALGVAAGPRAVGGGRRGVRGAREGSSTSTRGTRCCGRSTTTPSEPNPVLLGYDYWGGETLSFPVEGSYADPSADVDAEVEHGWNHSLGEIVTLLAGEGLRIELLDEKRVLDWPAPLLVPVGRRPSRLAAGPAGHPAPDVLPAGPQGRVGASSRSLRGVEAP